jgi:Cu(I)/Ag(I) efflux system membrane protein CusA/SilA
MCPAFLQPIENRILMTSTGIRAQVGVKIFGDNLDALQQKAFEIERVVNGVQGATGVAPSRVQGKPYLEIAVRRADLGRYGLSVQEVFRIGRGRPRRHHRRHHPQGPRTLAAAGPPRAG